MTQKSPAKNRTCESRSVSHEEYSQHGHQDGTDHLRGSTQTARGSGRTEVGVLAPGNLGVDIAIWFNVVQRMKQGGTSRQRKSFEASGMDKVALPWGAPIPWLSKQQHTRD